MSQLTRNIEKKDGEGDDTDGCHKFLLLLRNFLQKVTALDKVDFFTAFFSSMSFWVKLTCIHLLLEKVNKKQVKLPREILFNWKSTRKWESWAFVEKKLKMLKHCNLQSITRLWKII